MKNTTHTVLEWYFKSSQLNSYFLIWNLGWEIVQDQSFSVFDSDSTGLSVQNLWQPQLLAPKLWHICFILTDLGGLGSHSEEDWVVWIVMYVLGCQAQWCLIYEDINPVRLLDMNGKDQSRPVLYRRFFLSIFLNFHVNNICNAALGHRPTLYAPFDIHFDICLIFSLLYMLFTYICVMVTHVSSCHALVPCQKDAMYRIAVATLQ